VLLTVEGATATLILAVTAAAPGLAPESS